jgi:hypothetical protein
MQMFCDTIIVSESAWDKSAKAMDRKVAEFRCRDDLHLYGWIENEEIFVDIPIIRANTMNKDKG